MNLLVHAIPDSPAASSTRSRVRPPRRCVAATVSTSFLHCIAFPAALLLPLPPSAPILRLTLLLYACPQLITRVHAAHSDPTETQHAPPPLLLCASPLSAAPPAPSFPPLCHPTHTRIIAHLSTVYGIRCLTLVRPPLVLILVLIHDQPPFLHASCCFPRPISLPPPLPIIPHRFFAE
jgi:hypothetical protein